VGYFFLFPWVEELQKSTKKCESYSRKYVVFLWNTVYIVIRPELNINVNLSLYESARIYLSLNECLIYIEQHRPWEYGKCVPRL